MVVTARRFASEIQRFVRSFAARPTANMHPESQRLATAQSSDVGTQCTPPRPPSDDEAPGDVCGGLGEEDEAQPTTATSVKRKKTHGREECAVPAKTKKARRGISAERFDETSYYVENGVRKVYPYRFTFTTHAKGRWVGRTLREVFGEEFRARTPYEYERHIADGAVTVNGDRVTADYVLRHNDLMANAVHRHEVPVTCEPIGIVHEDAAVVVVNKPAGVPVHPCGRYRHNTVVFLLAKEHGLRDLKTVHRLDRLTSGVLIFGRTRDAAARLEAQIRAHVVRKRYVCRVEGRFPDDGPVECVEPMAVISYKIGVCKVSATGKPCRTTFRSAGYHAPSNTTVVMCEPQSGRMHQIRVHLQFLGHPIINDPLYNDAAVFGPHKGRGGHFGGKTDAQLVVDLIHAHNAENWHEPLLPESTLCPVAPLVPAKLSVAPITSETALQDACTQTGMDVPDSQYDPAKASVDPLCPDCRVRYKDPNPKDLVMYLHAYEYSGPDWTYKTPLPAWASVDWKEEP